MAVYPSHLVRQFDLPGGTTVTIRPIKPEDEAIERDFVNGLSDQSKYFRFMHALREITPEMVLRFTHIDYEREMALIAVLGEPPSEKEIAVARYVTYPGGQTCEFAVVVADEWQGQGIGTQLLKDLIHAAREKGLRRIEGAVLAENRNMLKFSEWIGFKLSRDPDDAQLVKLAMDL